MDDRRENLEAILYGYYIKYTRMQELVNTAFANFAPSSIIHVYVDVYDMLKPLYGKYVYANKKYTIVSAIINLVAHIREYFRSRHRMWAVVYLVYGRNETFNHTKFYQTFSDGKRELTLDFENISSVISSQLDMVRILAAYIQDVYFVEKSTMFSMFVADNIMKNTNIPSMVLTKSKYAYQIPAMFNNAILFRPKKYNGEDRSIAICGQSVLFQYYNKLSNAKTIEYLHGMSPKFLSALMSMTGLQEYNVNSVTNATIAIRIISEAILNNRLLNGYNADPEYVYSVLPELSRYIDSTSFSFRFKAIDLMFQHMIYSNMPESKDYSWNVNFKDPETVREINDKYFFDNPLDLNSL